MDITSFSKCWSMSRSCCRDEVIKQQVSDLELSMSLPDREEEEEVNQEKRPSATLILIPGQRQEQRLPIGRTDLWLNLFLSVCKSTV